MNKLSALVPLKSKITVYVPATVSVDQEIDNAAYVERVARTLSACFGGATASPVRGYWVSDSGELVKESTTTSWRRSVFLLAASQTGRTSRILDAGKVIASGT